MNVFYKMLSVFLLLSITLASHAQELSRIAGKVRDDRGEALSGVTVKVKSSGRAVVTDAQGQFAIDAGSSDVLVFSFLGFISKEESVGNKRSLDIELIEDISALEEVVVVGYGTQKKVNLTSSVSTIDAKSLESRAVSNVMAAMQGAAPGLVITRSGGQPGSEGFSTNIRGELSTGGASPLILIDGVPGTLSYTNAEDIASISVLKDASATAIYGSRGAGGVILVTTKKGMGKPKVNYQGMFTLKKIGLFPERINSWEEAEMQNLARINAGQSPDYTEELLGLLKDPNVYYRINPDNANAYQYFGNFNYPKLLLRNSSPRQDHNLSVSGSTEKESYLFSLGYNHDQGIFKVGPDASKRLNSRFNYSRELNDHFSIESKILYSQTNTENNVSGSSNDYGLIYNIVSQRSTMPIYLPQSDNKLYAAGSPGGITYALLKDGGKNQLRTDEFAATVSLQGKDLLVKGFNIRASYSPRMVTNTNDLTRIPVPIYNVNGRTGWAGGINLNSITKQRYRAMSNNMQLVGEYERVFNEKHELTARGGYRFDDYRYDAVSANASNLPTNDALSLSQYGDKDNTSVGDNIQSSALISFFGTAQYVYDSRFIVQGTLNREASSRLSPDVRWITLPGISAGWRINNESWFQSTTNLFDELKIRASWGRQANDPNSDNLNANNYDYINRLSRGDAYPFNNTRNTYYYVSSSATPLRTWEEITNTDAGLDFSILNRRLSGSFSYFWRKATGTYAVIQQPAVYGLGNPSTNLGEFKSWGWESSINWSDRIGEEFSYFVGLNIADNNNKVVSYQGSTSVGTGTVSLIEGYPKNSIFGYVTDGYFQNATEVADHANQQFSNTGPGDIRYVDLNKDGIISTGKGNLTDMGDLAFLGTTNPRYQFGLNLGFSYKNVDFSTFIQGVAKRRFQLPSIMTLPYIESWRQAWVIHKDYWTPENPDAMFPRLYMGGGSNSRVSDKWVVNGAYARLKNIQLGYSLPTLLTQKVGISKLRVFITGEDLFETSKSWHPYYDPETPNGQAFGYPFFRSGTVGVNITF